MPAGIDTRSAKVPHIQAGDPEQRFDRPAPQSGHRPQGPDTPGAARSPILQPETPSPISTISPQTSWPIVTGRETFVWPRLRILTSVPQVSAARIRSTTSPGPAVGGGSSRSSKRPIAVWTKARMDFAPSHITDCSAVEERRQPSNACIASRGRPRASKKRAGWFGQPARTSTREARKESASQKVFTQVPKGFQGLPPLRFTETSMFCL